MAEQAAHLVDANDCAPIARSDAAASS